MRYLRATCVLLVLSIPVFAGDINSPGFKAPVPPTPCENCLTAEPEGAKPDSFSEVFQELFLDLLLP